MQHFFQFLVFYIIHFDLNIFGRQVFDYNLSVIHFIVDFFTPTDNAFEDGVGLTLYEKASDKVKELREIQMGRLEGNDTFIIINFCANLLFR